MDEALLALEGYKARRTRMHRNAATTHTDYEKLPEMVLRQVQEYITRSLTSGDDVLAAFSGIPGPLEPRLGASKFGLPRPFRCGSSLAGQLDRGTEMWLP